MKIKLTTTPVKTKSYLGDSVYAEWDGCGVTLTTENGYGPSNTIYLEPEVIRALQAYVRRFTETP